MSNSVRSKAIHSDNPDEYDFWVNVCTPAMGAPPVCDGKGPAAGYQVVVPKQVDPDDEEELRMFDDYERRAIAKEAALQAEEDKDKTDRGGDSPARDAQAAAVEGAGAGGEVGKVKQLHRSARPPPEAKECHALGGLTNVTWSVITPRAPSHGVAITFHGGDTCLKRVVTRAPPPPPPPGRGKRDDKKKRSSSWRGDSDTTDDDTARYSSNSVVSWVPTPRSLTLHIRCDPTDTGPTDFASFLQLTRRVRVVEAEMCEYVVEWPSKLGCGTPGRRSVVSVVVHLIFGFASLFRPTRLLSLLMLAAIGVVATQVMRQRHALAVLWPALTRGDPAAWRRAKRLLMSKVRVRVNCVACLTGGCDARVCSTGTDRHVASAAVQQGWSRGVAPPG
jgi:hypothetical protein